MGDRIDRGEPAFILNERRSEPSGSYSAPILLRAPFRFVLSVLVVRWLLAALLAFVGALAFTGTLAEAMQPLVAASPILSWLYGPFSAADVARILGGVELGAALLLVLGSFSAALGLAGSLAAVASFAVSLSFLATTPGCFVTLATFPLPVPTLLGAFLLKEIFPFLAAVWSVLHAARSIRR